MEVSGIRAVFSLRDSEVAEYDKYLVQSFISETRILAIEGEELAEVIIPSLFSFFIDVRLVIGYIYRLRSQALMQKIPPSTARI